jgi:hypothetical protein
MSAFRGKADIGQHGDDVAFLTQSGHTTVQNRIPLEPCRIAEVDRFQFEIANGKGRQL